MVLESIEGEGLFTPGLSCEPGTRSRAWSQAQGTGALGTIYQSSSSRFLISLFISSGALLFPFVPSACFLPMLLAAVLVGAFSQQALNGFE